MCDSKVAHYSIGLGARSVFECTFAGLSCINGGEHEGQVPQQRPRRHGQLACWHAGMASGMSGVIMEGRLRGPIGVLCNGWPISAMFCSTLAVW